MKNENRNTIVHFEFPAKDPPKLSAFYEKLFGWKFSAVPQMEYWLIETKGKEEDMGINGGMYKRTGPNDGVHNFVSVDSVNDYLKKIEQNGGKTVVPRQEVPGGAIGLALDPDGNVFGLWETTGGGM